MEPRSKHHPPTPTIQSFIDSQGLHITIQTHSQTQPKKSYTGLISTFTDSESGVMHDYFYNLQELMEYIKDQDNVRVDEEKCLMRIVGRVNTKKSKEIVIAEIKLEKVVITPRMYLKEVISRCGHEQVISDLELKQFLKNVSQILLKDEQKQTGTNQKEFTYKTNDIRSQPEQKMQPTSSPNLKQIIKNIRIEIAEKIGQVQSSMTHAYDQLLKQVINNNQVLAKQVEERHKNNQENVRKKMEAIQERWGKQIKKNIEALVNQCEKKFATEEQFSAVVNKIGFLGSSLQNLKQNLKTNQNKSSQKLTASKRTPKRILASTWLDTTCRHSRNLELSNNKITVKQGWAYVFGKTHLSGTYTFTVNILSMTQHIGLGIIDQNYKFKNTLDKQPNWVYFDNDGDCWDGKGWKYNDSGFVIGETVKVVIDFDIGTIEWVVNDSIRAQIRCGEIKNSRVNWVAFIYLESQDDSVEIFQL